MVSRLPPGDARLSRVLVTGAAGYVGGRLVRHLRSSGASVVSTVRRKRDWLGETQTVVDLTEDDLGHLCDGIDAVVHLAGPNEIASAKAPDRAIAETVFGTHRIASAAARANVRRFVYVSTFHIYGDAVTPGARIDEGVVPRPRHPYAIARLASEHIANAEIDTVVLRLTNSVGAPAHASVDRWSLLVNDLCRQAVLTGELRLASDGTAWRDFIPLVDVLGVLSDVVSNEVAAETFNVGSGSSMTVRAVAEIVRSIAGELLGGPPAIIAPEPTAPPSAPFTVAVDKLTDHGLFRSGSITDAVEETLRFCIDQKRWLTGE